jgi:DNA-binding NarL/FixJ family response regulator
MAETMNTMSDPSVDTVSTITVFLADDNLLVREGVRALIDRQSDLQIVGVASDYDETVAGGGRAPPPQIV